MKRFLAGLVAVLGLSSLASAQDFSIGLAAGGTFGGGAAFNLHSNFTAHDVVRFSPSTSLAVRGNLDVYISGGALFHLSGGPLVSFRVRPVDIYVGPQLGVAFGNGGGAFAFTILSGVSYPLTSTLDLFGEFPITFFGGSTNFGLRGGVNIRL